jgi:Protein of unknown function (DUF1656)
MMTHTFCELVIGGVFVAPFATYAMAALFALLLIRPFLRFVGFSRIFSNSALAELSLFAIVLGLVMLFF